MQSIPYTLTVQQNYTNASIEHKKKIENIKQKTKQQTEIHVTWANTSVYQVSHIEPNISRILLNFSSDHSQVLNLP